LRVTFKVNEGGRDRAERESEEVLLWSGPKVEVWEQVQVGTLRPRFRFLPLGLPRTIQIFFEYLQMATLSLYIFNLLPLPFLDGTQLLDALLGFLHDSSYSFPADMLEEIDLETLEGGTGWGGRGRRQGHGRWKHWVGKMIRSGTMGLVVGCTGLGAINWIVGR